MSTTGRSGTERHEKIDGSDYEILWKKELGPLLQTSIANRFFLIGADISHTDAWPKDLTGKTPVTFRGDFTTPLT